MQPFLVRKIVTRGNEVPTNQSLGIWHGSCCGHKDSTKRAAEMQCCEFEMVLEFMRLKVDEFGIGRHYHRLDLADILMDYDLTTIDRLPDVVSLARSLQTRTGLAA